MQRALLSMTLMFSLPTLVLAGPMVIKSQDAPKKKFKDWTETAWVDGSPTGAIEENAIPKRRHYDFELSYEPAEQQLSWELTDRQGHTTALETTLSQWSLEALRIGIASQTGKLRLKEMSFTDLDDALLDQPIMKRSKRTLRRDRIGLFNFGSSMLDSAWAVNGKLILIRDKKPVLDEDQDVNLRFETLSNSTVSAAVFEVPEPSAATLLLLAVCLMRSRRSF